MRNHPRNWLSLIGLHSALMWCSPEYQTRGMCVAGIGRQLSAAIWLFKWLKFKISSGISGRSMPAWARCFTYVIFGSMALSDYQSTTCLSVGDKHTRAGTFCQTCRRFRNKSFMQVNRAETHENLAGLNRKQMAIIWNCMWPCST